MSCTSAAAISRSGRRRGCRCAVSRHNVATPTVCSSSPPAYEWWPSCVAGYERSGALASARCTSARSGSLLISATRNSRKPSSSSPSRRSAAAIVAGSTSPAGSSVRTSSCSLSRKRSTRPSTRTASPSAKRWSSSSTSFQMRACTRPVLSISSSARYGDPPFVRSRSFRATAYTPSTVRFSSSWLIAVTKGESRLGSMADVRPFRALRYAVPDLAAVVAPPYDVISEEQRQEYLARDPHNVVHLTLPDSEEQAARDLAAWRASGVLVEDEEPSYWWLSQDYVGPDGVARTRQGFVAALRAQPYEDRVILPHERPHAGPKEGRLRLLRATRTQLEPLFFLWDGTIEIDGLGEPDLAAAEAKLWRLDAEFGDALTEELRDAQLLIADGHHRYETTLAFGESPWLMVVIVPTDQEGLTIFPTHRLAQSANSASGTPIDRPGDELPGVVLYRGDDLRVARRGRGG